MRGFGEHLSRSLAVGIASIALLTSHPNRSSAITAEDVMQKMSKQERFSYLSGLIDMRAFLAAQAGDAKVSKCIYDAYYREKVGSAWSALFSALENFSDKQPATIVYLLIQKTCPN